MHKFRKLLLLLLFPLVMSSCGADKYYGYYMFQLGEEKGNHFGFHITLTKNKYPGTEEGVTEDSKIFKFGMKATGPFLPKDPDVTGEPSKTDEPLEYLKAKFLFVAVSLLNTEGTGPGVTGYYNIGKKDIADKGRTLDLNIVLPLDPIEPREDLVNALKKLIIAYVDGKNVTAVLPVSLDDIFYQLAWYGYFVSFDPIEIDDPIDAITVIDLTNPPAEYIQEGIELPIVLPGKQGEERLDTHPTDLEREQMNKMFDSINGTHAKIPGWTNIAHPTKPWFARDFHTLTATLIKQ